MRILASLIGVTALLACGAAQGQAAQPPEGESQTVDYELREGDRVVAMQTLRLELGRTASLSVGGSYSVRLRLDRAVGGTGPSAFLVRSSLSRADDAGVARLATPDMTVTQGLPARAQLASNLSVGVTVR